MALRNLVSGIQGCDPNDSMISNPLTRFVDTALQDPLRMQQMSEGYKLNQGVPNPSQSYFSHRVSIVQNPNMPPITSLNRPTENNRFNPMIGHPMDNNLFMPAITHTQNSSEQQIQNNWTQQFKSEQQQNVQQNIQQNFNHTPQQNVQQNYSMGLHMNPMMNSQPLYRPMQPFENQFIPPPFSSQPMYPLYYNQNNQDYTQQQKPETKIKEEEKVETKQQDDDCKDAATKLLEKLNETYNEEIINSDFAKFCQQISKGEIDLSKNNIDITLNDSKLNDIFINDTFDENKINDRMDDNVTKIFDQAEKEQLDTLDSIFDDPNMMKKYFDVMQQNGMLSEDYKEENDTFHFQKQNPYITNTLEYNNVMQTYQSLQQQNDIQNTQLLLEAAIQNNTTDDNKSEYWRLLGLLHADNDKDIEAIMCLKKANEEDPYDIDAMLALGVSLVNELDNMNAIELLCKWLDAHPEYNHLNALDNIRGDYMEQIVYVKDLFEKALLNNPNDYQLYVALGVICNITRDSKNAILYLLKACELDSTNANHWNKLGATLANFQSHDIALIAYQQALSINPKYTRAWCNLGIAHANLGKFNDALKFYLIASQLSPEAGHIWHYIHGTLLSMGKFEYLDALDSKDYNRLAMACDNSIMVSQLPQPLQQEVIHKTTNDTFNLMQSKITNLFE